MDTDTTDTQSAAPEYQSFWDFFSEVFVQFNNLNIPLKPAHKEVCETIEDAVLGSLGKQYVIVNIPPRIGKTKIAEALICWHMAFFPQAQYLITGYSSDNPEGSLAYVRQTIRSDWFLEIFGDIIGDIARSDKLTIKGGGNIFAGGITGGLLGKGGGLKEPGGGAIIIDDPAKPDEALTESGEKGVVNALELTLKNRRNSDQWCPIIIIAQRLAQNDLCGYVMDTYPDDYHLIKIPALNSKGESNFPETYSTKNLIAARDHVSSIIRFDFWSKMQQEPISLGGNLIPIDKFLRWDPADAWHPTLNPGGMQFERRCFTIDTALKTKEHNDYSCAQLWGLKQGKVYLIDQIHGKWESPELLVNCKAFYEKWMTRDPRGKIPLPPTRLLIESKAAGTGLAQQMRVLGMPAEEIERNVDKVTRVKAIMPHIETQLVVIPEDGSTPWIAGLINELSAFSADGTAKHDDRTDCLVDGCEELCGASISIFDVLGVPPSRKAA